MTAKEMFEKLRFKQLVLEDKSIAYVDNYGEIIFFNYQGHIKYPDNYILSMRILKAINQQCKELGWL